MPVCVTSIRPSSSHVAASRCATVQQLADADEIDNAERRHARMARPEEVARSAQHEVALGDLEVRPSSRSSPPSRRSRASSESGDWYNRKQYD